MEWVLKRGDESTAAEDVAGGDVVGQPRTRCRRRCGQAAAGVDVAGGDVVGQPRPPSAMSVSSFHPSSLIDLVGILSLGLRGVFVW